MDRTQRGRSRAWTSASSHRLSACSAVKALDARCSVSGVGGEPTLASLAPTTFAPSVLDSRMDSDKLDQAVQDWLRLECARLQLHSLVSPTC